jgi:hypothetical protein
MSKHTNITRRIGNVFVDSGQMMLGDPCYLEGWQGHDFASDRPGEYSYAGACTASLSDDSAGIIGTDHRGPREGMAAVFSTGYGDGSYPVDVTYNADGRVVAVTILFDEDTEDADDEECGHCGDVVSADDIYDGLCPECQTIGDDNDEEN